MILLFTHTVLELRSDDLRLGEGTLDRNREYLGGMRPRPSAIAIWDMATPRERRRVRYLEDDAPWRRENWGRAWSYFQQHADISANEK